MGVAGGYCIFLNEPDVLLTLYNGWKQYRNLLNDPALGNVAPNKINTWNGQWVNYCYSNDDVPIDIPALYRSDIFKQETNSVSINTVNGVHFISTFQKNILINPPQAISSALVKPTKLWGLFRSILNKPEDL